MKKILMIIAVTATSLSILSFTATNDKIVNPTPDTDPVYEMPGDVQEVVDKSCYGCHNSESSATKAKTKLNFDKLSTIKPGKLVGKLRKISKTVSTGKMPTEKFLENYPDRALSQDESDRLTSWADELAQKFGGE